MEGRALKYITVYCPFCGSKLIVKKPGWAQTGENPLKISCDEFSS